MHRRWQSRSRPSSAKSPTRASVSGGSGSCRDDPTLAAPHRRPSTMIGTPTPERRPNSWRYLRSAECASSWLSRRGGPTSAEYHRRDAFAVERKTLPDRHLFLRPTVVVAGKQNRRAVGLIADQSCVVDSKAAGQFLRHRGEHLGRHHRPRHQGGNTPQGGLLVSKHAELIPAFFGLLTAPMCFGRT